MGNSNQHQPGESSGAATCSAFRVSARKTGLDGTGTGFVWQNGGLIKCVGDNHDSRKDANAAARAWIKQNAKGCDSREEK